MATTRNTFSATSGASSRIKATEAVRKATAGKVVTEAQIEVLTAVFTQPPRTTVPPTTGPATPFPLPQPQPQTQPQPQPQPAEPETDFEIETKLQLLINAIPRANPGDIITSEYHNSLRDAIRGIASRIGLSVRATSEFQILTFSPAFLPTMQKNSTALNLKWDVTLNRAVLPAVIAEADLNRPVSGGFVVQLPDNAAIFQMVVRGTRLGTAAPNPKEFNVSLNRAKFGKEATDPVPLIVMDLKAVKDGPFEEEANVKLTDDEKNRFNSEFLITTTTIERQIIDNSTWNYTVVAEWTAGAQTAAKFEINSIQILCTV